MDGFQGREFNTDKSNGRHFESLTGPAKTNRRHIGLEDLPGVFTNRLPFNRISGSARSRDLRRPACTTKHQRRLIMKHTESLRVSSLCKLASVLGLAVILLSFGALPTVSADDGVPFPNGFRDWFVV